MVMNINDKLDYWKKRLLDLGKRNRLINCPLPNALKPIRRHSLLIIRPSSFDLWTSLNENDESISFPLPNEFDEDQDEIEEFEYDDDDVKTNQSVVETNKTLRSLMKKAKEFNEEKGLNALYLAFGFLNWKENGTTGQDMRSPLLLLPVKLEQEDLFKPIVLSRSDEEIMSNHPLAQKFLVDFNLTLPLSTEDISLADYLNEVQQVVKSMGWSISSDVAQLSLFTFMKVNMYYDLERNADAICAHSIVRALNGESSINVSDVLDINGFHHDSTPPQEVFSVVDADASQQDAILLAKRGVSFVLQGPPGTGKSQTITNIIAELLADGKKVLFVSEKMAALEVVYKRLSRVQLSNFCLTLHSHNAKRREVLDQFEKSIKLSRANFQVRQDACSRLALLKENREALNLYDEQLHTVIEPLGKTIFQVNGMLAILENSQNIDYIQTNAADFTPEMFAQCESALSELARVIDKSGYQENNPWNGCVLTQPPTFEFRQRFLVDTGQLINELHTGVNLLAQINSIIGTDKIDWSYLELPQISDINDCVKHSPVVEFSWLKINHLAAISNLEAYYSALNKREKTIKERDNINQRLSSTVKQLEDSNILYIRERELLVEAETKSRDAHILLTDRYDEKILDIDLAGMLSRYRSKYRTWTRFVNSAYQKDRKELLSFCKKAEKLTYEDGLNLLDQIEKTISLSAAHNKQVENIKIIDSFLKNNKSLHLELINELQQIESLLNTTATEVETTKSALLSVFKNVITDSRNIDIQINENMEFTDIRKKLEWCLGFNELLKRYGFRRSFILAACRRDEDLCSGFRQMVEEVNHWATIVKSPLDKFSNYFDDTHKQFLPYMPITKLLSFVKECTENLTALENLIDFRIANNRIIKLGLKGFLDEVKQLKVDADKINDAFSKCFYRSWLDAVEPRFPAINEFRRMRQDNTVKMFADLDLGHFDIAKGILISRLVSRLPNFDAFSSNGELAILNREMKKKRKLMPTRLLIESLPKLLPSIKPCMMMSPLSVSTYLGRSSYEFDTVIFDEASQVFTEDAIGAIFRAKQAIIAGDSKQLPPTDFFSSAMSADDNYEEDDGAVNDAGAFESLLDEATMLPTQTLRWHYRSRDEHLIAFSNAKIYGGNLITFPSSIEKSPDMGVEYVYVKGGMYVRGGKKGNRAEAEKVAELVFEHFHENPDRSLGVIAFGEIQQSAITDALILKRRQNPSYESFFKEDGMESLFIKNLETVQGDERDTIIFSIGYAPDEAGKFSMNFGPLSREGGERRLNVAITRARYNLKLVGSILPTDIKIDSLRWQGPRLLRQYIDFAFKGENAILGEIFSNDDVQFDSPFETSVYNFLTANGYDVATQVGCSDYRIDLAVKHPVYNGRFAIGIECDGAMYHSARTARERDRLRKTVLEDMGWEIYRIWSTDWIKDNYTEGKQLLLAVQQAIDNYHEAVPKLPRHPSNLSDFMVVESQTESEHRKKGYEEKQRQLQSIYFGSNADEIPLEDFSNVMLKVIQNAIGLNKMEIFKETASYGYGWKRLGSTIKERMESAFNSLVRQDKIKIDVGGKVGIK
jgi:very-short-patch-repair endonuclease